MPGREEIVSRVKNALALTPERIEVAVTLGMAIDTVLDSYEAIGERFETPLQQSSAEIVNLSSRLLDKHQELVKELSGMLHGFVSSEMPALRDASGVAQAAREFNTTMHARISNGTESLLQNMADSISRSTDTSQQEIAAAIRPDTGGAILANLARVIEPLYSLLSVSGLEDQLNELEPRAGGRNVRERGHAFYLTQGGLFIVATSLMIANQIRDEEQDIPENSFTAITYQAVACVVTFMHFYRVHHLNSRLQTARTGMNEQLNAIMQKLERPDRVDERGFDFMRSLREAWSKITGDDLEREENIRPAGDVVADIRGQIDNIVNAVTNLTRIGTGDRTVVRAVDLTLVERINELIMAAKRLQESNYTDSESIDENVGELITHLDNIATATREFRENITERTDEVELDDSLPAAVRVELGGILDAIRQHKDVVGSRIKVGEEVATLKDLEESVNTVIRDLRRNIGLRESGDLDSAIPVITRITGDIKGQIARIKRDCGELFSAAGAEEAKQEAAEQDRDEEVGEVEQQLNGLMQQYEEFKEMIGEIAKGYKEKRDMVELLKGANDKLKEEETRLKKENAELRVDSNSLRDQVRQLIGERDEILAKLSSTEEEREEGRYYRDMVREQRSKASGSERDGK